VGLVVVDVVTGRSANLHNDLLARLAAPPAVYLHAELYAAAYRPVERSGQPSLDIWQEALSVGEVTLYAIVATRRLQRASGIGSNL
jgi:hypothetical protein